MTLSTQRVYDMQESVMILFQLENIYFLEVLFHACNLYTHQQVRMWRLHCYVRKQSSPLYLV